MDPELAKLADSIPVFDSAASLKAMMSSPGFYNKSQLAFYNGAADAIITNPAFINLLVDDWMIHKGLGVFDTLNVIDKRPYLLDKHVYRFVNSIKSIGIEPPCSAARIQEIILSLIAYTGEKDLAVRYWCSAGQGMDKKGGKSVLYVVVAKAGLPKPFGGTNDITVSKAPVKEEVIWKAKLTSANNELTTGLIGPAVNLIIDTTGYFKLNPHFTVCCLTVDGTLCIPTEGEIMPIEDSLAEFVTKTLIPEGDVKKVERKPMEVSYYREKAKEMFLISGMPLFTNKRNR